MKTLDKNNYNDLHNIIMLLPKFVLFVVGGIVTLFDNILSEMKENNLFLTGSALTVNFFILTSSASIMFKIVISVLGAILTIISLINQSILLAKNKPTWLIVVYVTKVVSFIVPKKLRHRKRNASIEKSKK